MGNILFIFNYCFDYKYNIINFYLRSKFILINYILGNKYIFILLNYELKIYFFINIGFVNIIFILYLIYL